MAGFSDSEKALFESLGNPLEAGNANSKPATATPTDADFEALGSPLESSTVSQAAPVASAAPALDALDAEIKAAQERLAKAAAPVDRKSVV